jgi:hypothetical protein
MPKRPAQIITIESSHEKGEQVVADAMRLQQTTPLQRASQHEYTHRRRSRGGLSRDPERPDCVAEVVGLEVRRETGKE